MVSNEVLYIGKELYNVTGGVWTPITSRSRFKMLIFSVFFLLRKFAHRCVLIFEKERTSRIYMRFKRHRLLFPNKILWKKVKVEIPKLIQKREI